MARFRLRATSVSLRQILATATLSALVSLAPERGLSSELDIANTLVRTAVQRRTCHGLGQASSPVDRGAAPVASHVRSIDPLVLEILRRGNALSPTFRNVIEQLDKSDLIVYVSRGRCGETEAPGCVIHGVTTVPGARYAHVVIALDKFREDRRATWGVIVAGHELYHAFEIANAQWVRSTKDVTDLYAQIGTGCKDGSTNCYETPGALAIGRRVARELGSAVASK